MSGQWPRSRTPFNCILIVLFSLSLFSGCAIRHPDADGVLSIRIDNTLKRFSSSINGGDAFLTKSEGVLVFPSVVKAGIAFGGEYGEGALLVGDDIVDYYSTAGASFGFQLGAQRKSLVLVFMTDESLFHFQNSSGWKVGVDGSVALLEWGVGEDINSIDISSPVVGFVFDNEGLMYNLTLEGAKFTKLPK
ncbi:YSC84-related protein [Desulfopila sp. IMCC35008]|uniref:lipid-binding SYLF domain-containing protein n=1 Tax=Desulfopila sp. IMCC35008 TaxID=2653858 RepID=UPI0013D595B0|nr:YSC84-related protein [Desulfopila sp. IMCC35008]